MRIVFLSHYFTPEGNAPATRVHAVARDWVREGHRVTVITCAPNVPDGVLYPGYRNRLVQREVVDGIDVIRVWTHLAPNRGTLRRALNYASYVAPAVAAGLSIARPDVVIATSPQPFCGLAGALLARLRGVPFILEVRDLWPASIVAVGALRNPKLIQLLERGERRMYAAADRIVTVGEGYRRELLARGVPSDKVGVIPNGIEAADLAPRAPDPALRARLGVGDAFLCAYVGTIGMAAGLEVVLEAAHILRQAGRNDVRFLLVGDGASREALEAKARAEGLDEIVFTGRLDKESVRAMLASVDACLVHLRPSPLFTTVLPSKLFEAAAFARPVILGVEGDAARLLEMSGGGLCIAPGSASALVDAVLRLAKDPALRAKLGRSGREYLAPRFERSKLSAEYLAVLREVLRDRQTATKWGAAPQPRSTTSIWAAARPRNGGK